MGSIQFIHAVGDDFRSLSTYFQIAAIRIDNPSSSWLRVSGVEQFVPPYTLGWTYDITPTMLNLNILFVDSPSRTPSKLVGDPVTIYLYDEPIGNSSGFASGATEYQQPGVGDVQYRLDSFLLVDTGLTIGATVTPSPGFRFVLVSLTVAMGLATAAAGQVMRTPVQVNLVDGFGAQLFPPIVLSPESPMAGPLAPTARSLNVNGTIEFSGLVSPGGGKVAIDTYLIFYSQRG